MQIKVEIETKVESEGSEQRWGRFRSRWRPDHQIDKEQPKIEEETRSRLC